MHYTSLPASGDSPRLGSPEPSSSQYQPQSPVVIQAQVQAQEQLGAVGGVTTPQPIKHSATIVSPWENVVKTAKEFKAGMCTIKSMQDLAADLGQMMANALIMGNADLVDRLENEFKSSFSGIKLLDCLQSGDINIFSREKLHSVGSNLLTLAADFKQVKAATDTARFSLFPLYTVVRSVGKNFEEGKCCIEDMDKLYQAWKALLGITEHIKSTWATEVKRVNKQNTGGFSSVDKFLSSRKPNSLSNSDLSILGRNLVVFAEHLKVKDGPVAEQEDLIKLD